MPAVLKYQGQLLVCVLVQLVLGLYDKVIPIPTVSSGFPGLSALGGTPMAGFIQSDRTGLNQSDRTGIGQLLPGPRTKNNWQRLKGKLLDLRFAHGESSISCLEWAGIK